MKDLNIAHYSDLDNRVLEALKVLSYCQARLLSNPTPTLIKVEKEAHYKWASLALDEEKFMKQKSRVNWLESGDMNMAYFHRMMTLRRSVNHIHYLINEEGTKLDSCDEI